MKTREDFPTSLKYKFYVLSCKFEQFKQIGQYMQRPLPVDKDPQIKYDQEFIDNLGISDVVKSSSLKINQASYDNSFQQTNIFKMFVNRSKQPLKTRDVDEKINSKQKQPQKLQIYQIIEQKPQIQHLQKNNSSKFNNSEKDRGKNQSLQKESPLNFKNKNSNQQSQTKCIIKSKILNNQIQQTQQDSGKGMKQQTNIQRVQENRDSDIEKQQENQMVKVQPLEIEQQGRANQSQQSSLINDSHISIQQDLGYMKKRNQISQAGEQQVGEITSSLSQQKLKSIAKLDIKQNKDENQNQVLTTQSSKSKIKKQEVLMNANFPIQKINQEELQMKEIRKFQAGQEADINNQQSSILNKSNYEEQDINRAQSTMTHKLDQSAKEQSKENQNSLEEQCEEKIQAKQQLVIFKNNQTHVNLKRIEMNPVKQSDQKELQQEAKKSLNLGQSSQYSIKESEEQFINSKHLDQQKQNQNYLIDHNCQHGSLVNQKEEQIISKKQQDKIRSSSLNLNSNDEDNCSNLSRSSSLAQDKSKQFKYTTTNIETKKNNHKVSSKCKAKKVYIQKAQQKTQKSQQIQNQLSGESLKKQDVKIVKPNILQKFLNEYKKTFNRDWLNNSHNSHNPRNNNIKPIIANNKQNQHININKVEAKDIPQDGKDSVNRGQNKIQEQYKSDDKLNESKILQQKIQQVRINKIQQKIDNLVSNNYKLETQLKVSLTSISQLLEKVEKIQRINMNLQKQNKIIREQFNSSIAARNKDNEESFRLFKQKIQFLESTTVGLNQQIYKIGSNIFKELYSDQHQISRKNSR